jgi:hypothetical protein
MTAKNCEIIPEKGGYCFTDFSADKLDNDYTSKRMLFNNFWFGKFNSRYIHLLCL